MVHCHARLGSDHARFLRGFALAGKQRRYPKASSMPSAACLPMHWYPVRVAVEAERLPGGM
jgi:hypothetical protein